MTFERKLIKYLADVLIGQRNMLIQVIQVLVLS
jgi:hypothetical protein